MNANEVIANRALELMGKRKGEYEYCDPHDHVNAAQSTNDAYPSALHIALALGNRKLIRRTEEPDRLPPDQSEGVRSHREDGAHPTPGRRADDIGAGIRGLRAEPGR